MFIKLSKISLKKGPKKALKSLAVFLLVASWLLTGYPGFWLPAKNGEVVRFPSKIYQVHAATNTETFTSSTSWTAPPGVTSVTAECWGTGGSGGGSTSATAGGSGGGAGAYAKTNSVAVTAGNSYTVTIGALGSTGAGAAGGAGGDTSFVGNSSQQCMAKGGGGGAINGGSGGTGGSGTASTGDTKFNGGNGYTTAAISGGGGGGSGGTGSNGNNATSQTGATAVTGGGNGGNGGSGTALENGFSPTTPPGGAGGGGGCKYKAGKGCTTAGGTNTRGAVGSAGQVKITYTVYAVLGNGTDPSTNTFAPESGITDAGTFTVQSTINTDSITALTVTLAGSGTPYDGLAEVRITNDGGTTTYFSAVTSFSSNSVSFSGGTAIPVTTTETAYKIRITPKTHANMAAPPGASYAFSPYVASFTSTNTQTGSDSNANTITIDNTSPNGVTSVSGSGGSQAVTLNWTTSNSGDFATTNGSVILRWTGSSAGSEVPAEGNTSYVAGNTISTATVACVISSAASTALSKIDGSGGSAGCTTTPLASGQAYTYKAFQVDTNGNYDVGVLIGTFTTSAASPVLTQNNFRFYVTANSVTLTDSWPSGTLNLGEKAVLTQLPATNLTLKSGDKIRMKINFSVATSNLSAGTQAFQLEYSAAEDCTTASSWTAVGAKASGSIWRLYDEASIGDSTAEVNNLSDSTVGAEGYYSEINPSSNNPNAVNTGQYSEWDWPVEDNGAAENTTYCFRMAKSGGTAFDSYGSGSYPKITTAPGTSVLMRHGNFFQNSGEKGFFWVN